MVYSIKGAKLTTIRNFKDANTNVPASLDTSALPSSSANTVPVYIPKAMAWGPTWGSSVVTSPTATQRNFYSVNMNQVNLSQWEQDDTTGRITNLTREGVVTIPTYWSAVGQQTNLESAEVDPIIKFTLAEDMSYSEATNKLYFPLGQFGQHGVASLGPLTPTFEASTWDARETDLALTYGYMPDFNQRFDIESATSDNYVVVSQYNGGIAFYDISTLEWVGSLKLPYWEGQPLAVTGIAVKEFNSKKYLFAHVYAKSYVDVDAANKIPKVLIYDIDAIVTGDLYQEADDPAAPAGTAVPIGIIFEKGSEYLGPTGGNATRVRTTYGFDAGLVPGSEIYISGEPDPVERIVCAVRGYLWTEFYDISHIIIPDSLTAGDENPASITSSYADLIVADPGCDGFAGMVSVPTISSWLDTFAISSRPAYSTVPATVCASDGPPAGARAHHSWGEASVAPGYNLAYQTAYGGTCFAGSFVVLGGNANQNATEQVGATPHAFALVTMEYSSPSLDEFKVNYGGMLVSQMGLTSMMETYADLNFIPSTNDAYGGWVAGSVRAAHGTLVAQLPPEDDVATINTALHADVSTPWDSGVPGGCTEAAWEPAGASGQLPGGDPWPEYETSYYRFPGKWQATALLYGAAAASYTFPAYASSRYPCQSALPVNPALDPSTIYSAFEVNINATASWNVWYPDDYPDQPPPTLAQFSTHGGFEVLHAVAHPSGDADRFDDVIFIADRASNSTYAFYANPGSASVMLDKTDWIYPRNQGVAVVSSSIYDKSLVGCISQEKYYNIAYWDDRTQTFDTGLSADSNFLRIPNCFPRLDNPGSSIGSSFQMFGALGVKGPILGTDPIELSETTTHFWGALKPGLDDYRSYFDIFLVAASDLEASTPDANGYLDCAASLSRFRREPDPGGDDKICNTLVHFGDETTKSTRGKLAIWDAKQIGKYVISFVVGYPAAATVPTRHYVAVHELTWSKGTGTVCESCPGWDADDVMYWSTQGEPTAQQLIAKPIRIIPLTDYAGQIIYQGEGDTITVAPCEEYIAASNARGTFVLYTGTTDLSSSPGFPKPVAGLAYGKIPVTGDGPSGSDPTDDQWRGWRTGIHAGSGFGGNISDALLGATKSSRVAKAPTWPLVDEDNVAFSAPSDPTDPPPGAAVPGPASGMSGRQLPFKTMASNICQFREEGSNLYFYIPTQPWTMWLIDKTAAVAYAASSPLASDSSPTEVLELVGGLDKDQVTSRPRYGVSLGDYLYWFGDMGGFAT